VLDAQEVPPVRPLVTRVTSASSGISYTVAAGDTLAGIAGRSCGEPGDWPAIWHQNQAEVPDPDLIYPGQTLTFTCDEVAASSSPSSSPAPPPGPTPDTPAPVAASGFYSCSALESLWEQAGGPAGEAFMAAEIAMAESGGNPDATDHDSNGTTDVGLFQINSSHGSLAAYDPLANAQAAVSISDGGGDWSPWVTFEKDLYPGKC
jgi:hypothetical protein